MTTVLDIVGATILAGVLMLMVLQMNAKMTDTDFEANLEVGTQEEVTFIKEIIEHDFYKVGYHASCAILLADSTRFTFLSDMSNTGVIDTVRYYVRPGIVASNTNLKALCRVVGTGPESKLGITMLKLAYWGSDGAPKTCPVDSGSLADITSIKIQLAVESPYKVETTDTSRAMTYWEGFISPKNLRGIK